MSFEFGTLHEVLLVKRIITLAVSRSLSCQVEDD